MAVRIDAVVAASWARIAAVAVAVFGAAGTAQAVPSASDRAGVVQLDIGQGDLRAGAPCIVTGYSYHAQQMIAERRISSDHVESVVYSTCSGAKRQSNGTWRYRSKAITVITNDNGYVITVWRN